MNLTKNKINFEFGVLLNMNLVEITSLNELENIIMKSDNRKQLIFKHSNACPISTMAFNEMKKYLNASPSKDVDYSLVIVQVARNVSNEVESKLNVKHESPQAILLYKGQATWHKSHYDITKTSLTSGIGS